MFKFLVITIFTGSVFITSSKFVTEINTPQLFFVVASLLVSILIGAMSKKNIRLCMCKEIFWGINIVSFIQAFYGLFQFMGWQSSNHTNFSITGSFDNPAGFAAVLSLGFPTALFLLKNGKIIEKYLASTILVLIAIAIILSGSRTGILAMVISTIVFWGFRNDVINKIHQLRYYKLLPVLILSITVIGFSILYHSKKDSANGRFLIWKVSSEMIKDKPLIGHGHGAFQAKYMDYQAEYFKNNSNSKFKHLADNVKHPFNEFIKVTVEFGLIGLMVVISLLFLIFWRIIKSENGNKTVVLSGLVSFLVFACFSYPLQYISVWILLALYLSILIPKKEFKIRNTSISILTRAVIIIACLFSLQYIYQQMRAEIKWKTIAVNSLHGNTEEMLPEYEILYSKYLTQNPYFLFNYGAELNVSGHYEKSIEILKECQKKFNDYDLQIILADNYNKIDKPEMAIQTYEYASCMIPCRFIPLYQIFKTYKQTGQQGKAIQYANKIISKEVKIPSITVTSIISEAKQFLKKHKSTFGNKAIIRQPWRPQHIQPLVLPSPMRSN